MVSMMDLFVAISRIRIFSLLSVISASMNSNLSLVKYSSIGKVP